MKIFSLQNVKSVLPSWFCRSPPAFCQGTVLCSGVEAGEKEMDLGELASYQVCHCLDWPDLSGKLEPHCLHVNQVSCLPNCLMISCAVLERVGPFHPSVSKPMSSGLTRTVQGKSSKLNFSWPVEIICLISSHHCPPFPRPSVLEHQILNTFSTYKVLLL